MFYIFVFGCYNILETYLIQISWFENFNNIRNLESRKKQQQNLLEYLLPIHVINRFDLCQFILDKRKVFRR